jgi:long-chain fatty acid transport protein
MNKHLFAAIAVAVPALAQATNGMLMEGYGPVASGMGGASLALDNGTAAAANNPATLGLMGTGARLDVAAGLLGPQVSSQVGGMVADSSGTSYVMPAIGYARRHGDLVFGLAVFAQGGMGTDYGADSFLAMGSGSPVRSELGVGRVMLPLAFTAAPDLVVGGSIDYVWSTLDMRMAASGAQLGSMVTGAGGNLAAALPALGGASWARLDFSDDNKFSGAARSSGLAGKLGLLYRVDPTLSVGAAFHTKTHLRDMRTSERGAQLSAQGGFSDTGRMVIEDFQMPAQLGVGLSWQATPALQLAADLKRIYWSDVMSSFKMRYESAGMGGSVSFALPQQWNDQTVTNLGAAWRVSDALVLRGGMNLSTNPVPDAYVNPLFPAIVKRHYTAGFGVATSAAGELNTSVAYAPTVAVLSGSGVEIRHRQLNLQLMYSHRF